jgi:hypothetical protein
MRFVRKLLTNIKFRTQLNSERSGGYVHVDVQYACGLTDTMEFLLTEDFDPETFSTEATDYHHQNCPTCQGFGDE